jgi:Na+-transporting NADH:ubiquinone oxidoreductase subunit NqrC
MVIASNWKTILVLLQLGLLAVTIVAGTALAGEPIDNPFGP